jgi:hypothetical protein
MWARRNGHRLKSRDDDLMTTQIRPIVHQANLAREDEALLELCWSSASTLEGVADGRGQWKWTVDDAAWMGDWSSD